MLKTIESITHDFDGDVLIDIGGNVGMWTIELLGVFQKIYFIEPSQLAITEARKNVEVHCQFYNRPDLRYRVEYIKKICTDRSGDRLSISTTTEDTGNFSIFAKELYGPDNVRLSEDNIETMKLDDLMFNIPDNSKVTIKVDTEGCDLDVLLGGIEVIKKFRPTLCIEFHWHMNYDENKRNKFFELIESLNYKIQKFSFACYHHEADKLFDHKHTGHQLQNLHFQTLMIPQ